MRERIINFMAVAVWVIAGVVLAIIFVGWQVAMLRAEAREKQVKMTARAQVVSIAQSLDGETDERGIYLNPTSRELAAIDPWGNRIRVDYSMDGIRQSLTVFSFGPDGLAYTRDDIVASRGTTNLKGIGNGIRKGIGETSRNATVGMIEGIKEGVMGDDTSN